MATKKDTTQRLDDLDARFAEEDAQDAKDTGILSDIETYEGFGDTAVTPRELDGKPYAEHQS